MHQLNYFKSLMIGMLSTVPVLMLVTVPAFAQDKQPATTQPEQSSSCCCKKMMSDTTNKMPAGMSHPMLMPQK